MCSLAAQDDLLSNIDLPMQHSPIHGMKTSHELAHNQIIIDGYHVAG